MQVELNGKQYPVEFGMAAFRDLKRRAKLDIPQVQKVLQDMTKKPKEVGINQLETVGQLILSGIRNGCRKAKQKEPDLSIDDIFDLMDDAKKFESIMDAYANNAKVDDSKN